MKRVHFLRPWALTKGMCVLPPPKKKELVSFLDFIFISFSHDPSILPKCWVWVPFYIHLLMNANYYVGVSHCTKYIFWVSNLCKNTQ